MSPARSSASPRDGLAGAIFDLDGVITDTARIHAQAWKSLFDELREHTSHDFAPFDPQVDYPELVDGRPRIDGVRAFLASRGIELSEGPSDAEPGYDSLWALGNRKNALFRDSLAQQGVEVNDAAVTFIRELRAAGVRLAIVTASRNGRPILHAADLDDLVDTVVDGVVATDRGLPGKPAPDTVLFATEQLGLSPDRCALFEDAVSGIEAGRNAGCGVVIGVDSGTRREPLRMAGADLVVRNIDEEVSLAQLDRFIERAQDTRPSAIFHWQAFLERLGDAKPAVFLDYDGTLTPIVDRPELAILAPDMRTTVARLADAVPTVIISGRGLDDVRRLVGLRDLIYAGSHGFEIMGPEQSELQYTVDPEYEALIRDAVEALQQSLSSIDGVIVEPKRFSVAVHYRLVESSRISAVESAVAELVDEQPKLKKTTGKKVLEIRPNLEWDKGKALRWVLQALELDRPDVIPLYIGDDDTDEDAFSAIEPEGIGILVTDTPEATAASHVLQDPRDVRIFLERLADRYDSARA